MVFIYSLSLIVAFIYIFIISHLFTTWREIEEWSTDDHFQPETKVSIIIPFRNEEARIQQCIASVLSNRYPKQLYEVIAINDHSDDNSAEIVKAIAAKNLKYFSLKDATSNSALKGKKEALKFGISKAEGKLIITLDGDCIVGKLWLRQLVSYYEYSKLPIIVGMVSLIGENNVLESFQIMDTCGTMGLHAAGIHNRTHFLANGANLIFEKKLFEEIDPYKENMNFASGDDVFFVNKVAAQNPHNIGFLKSKESIVETYCLKNWQSLWNQRKRWASKSSAFSGGLYKWITGIIWLLSLTLSLNLLLIPFSSFTTVYIIAIQLLIISIVNYVYLKNMTHYFGKSESLRFFLPGLLMHLLYILIGGFIAMIGGKYSWKGRRVN